MEDTAICCGPSTSECDVDGICLAGQRCLWDARHPNGVNSFDHLGWALLTIFQSMTLEGWTVVMYMLQAADAFMYPVATLYFVLLIFFGSFFLINLFLAVIFESFSSASELQRREASTKRASLLRNKAGDARTSFASLRQRLSASLSAWVSNHPLLPRKGLMRSALTWRDDRVRRVTTTRWFEWASLLLILCNTIILCAYHHDMTYSQEQALEVSNVVLTLVFTIELLLKMIGEG